MSQRYIVETPEQNIVGPIIKGTDDLDGVVTIYCEDTNQLVQVNGWLADIQPYNED